MYLYLDLSSFSQIYLVLFNEAGRVAQKKVKGQSRDLVVVVDRFLTQNKLGIGKIEGMVVVQGVGSFTSSRIAVVFANMFCLVQKKPVIGVKPDSEDWSEFTNTIIRTKVKYLLPTYSGHPNIG